MQPSQIGLNMYSVDYFARTDFESTLGAVKEIGYGAVEITSYYSLKPSEIRKLVKRQGMVIPSVHAGISFDEPKIKQNFERLAEAVVSIGSQYIVIPWLPIRDGLSNFELEFLQNRLEDLVDVTERNKLILVLHNDSREFNQVELKVKSKSSKSDAITLVIDQLLEPYDSSQVQLELDFGSLYASGLNPFKVYEQYQERITFVHLHNITEGRLECLLQDGVIDYSKYLRQLTNIQSKVLYIEQQSGVDKQLENAQKNFQYISDLLQL